MGTIKRTGKKPRAMLFQLFPSFCNLIFLVSDLQLTRAATVEPCPSLPENHTLSLYPAGLAGTCGSLRRNAGVTEEGKVLLLKIHNEVRNKVALGEEHGQPPAADMRKLVWDEELALSAQRWADQCHFGHDRVRDLCDGTYVGQNVFISYSSSENIGG